MKIIIRSCIAIVVTTLMIFFSSCSNEKATAPTIASSIDVIKNEMKKNDLVSIHEAKGLNMLKKTLSGTELDMNLVEDVQAYIKSPNHTKLSAELSQVFNLIQTQGNISDSDSEALDELMSLISVGD